MELNSNADALSGLQANQTYMDTVGNNIANVNTIGYKTQSIRFEDMLSQTLGYGTSANKVSEGTNPMQIGMGVGQGEVKTINTQGSVQDTGRLTDMAIQGDGYFIVNDGQQNFYTRDGSFNVSPDGTLTTANGMAVQGWSPANADGSFNTTAPAGAVKIPLGSVNATPTTSTSLAGNLDASQAVYAAGATPPSTETGGVFRTTMNVYDSQGAAHTLNLTLTKSAANTWQYTVAPAGSDVTGITPASAASGQLNFSPSGALLGYGTGSPPSTTPPVLNIAYAGGPAAGNVTVDFSHISQVSGNSQVNVATSDGAASGSISTFSIGKDGSVTAVYSNGTNEKIAQIALASFRNPDGLVREGNNLYGAGANSGVPQVGTASQGGLGQWFRGNSKARTSTWLRSSRR